MPRVKKTENKEKEIQKRNNRFIYAVGKRKEAVARIKLYPNGGSELKKSLPAGKAGFLELDFS